MLKCDMHIHTNYSHDGESSVEEVLEKAKKVGLDAIAIVDHDTVAGAQHALTIKSDVLVIPGIEVSTKHGHLLVLGVNKVIPPGLDFFKTVKIARDMGGLLILPHPYHQLRHGVAIKLKSAIEAVDAVESFNSRYIVGSANKKAGRKARFFGKPCVAGSDAHNARFVGYGITKIDAEKNIPSIFAAIRGGKTEAGGKMTPLRAYTGQSLKNTKRKIMRRVHRR
ncbi:PHP domain-containing protein [Methanomicrobium antiquum]|uniref:PHP domain-containing protein n=1 Tax=Methanomicrobium antiquum TaxID=487686 RepID=A0AAF0G0V9_9EURY|nr:PHP domain-containing protein [Methanomicrobium antiquum]WFN37999.1 PHP domain-containing protein [Methanomicrobium antiquum]